MRSLKCAAANFFPPPLPSPPVPFAPFLAGGRFIPVPSCCPRSWRNTIAYPGCTLPRGRSLNFYAALRVPPGPFRRQRKRMPRPAGSISFVLRGHPNRLIDRFAMRILRTWWREMFLVCCENFLSFMDCPMLSLEKYFIIANVFCRRAEDAFYILLFDWADLWHLH